MFTSEGKKKAASSAKPEAARPPPKTFILLQWLTIRRNAFTKKSRSFLQLAKERRFDEICYVLQRKTEINWLIVSEDSRVSTFESLHALCLFRPTASVVQAVIDTLKATVSKNVDATMVVDKRGRTPLHMAAASGCSTAVMDLLMRENTAVLTLDHEGRYPLHWACTYNPGRGSKKNADDRVQVIRQLIEAYPVSVVTKDREGNTPMILATKNKADKRILAALHFVARILPVNVAKDPASTVTESTIEIPQEAVCSYGDDDDDVSSVGSRGVSRHPRRYMNTEQKSPNLVFI
jgi:hypothetical protein